MGETALSSNKDEQNFTGEKRVYDENLTGDLL